MSLFDEAGLTGRRVAITGAASGIGRATARAFAHAGASVAALDVNPQGLQEIGAELACHTSVCDVTDETSVKAAFEQTTASLGGLDILVSNAGSAAQGSIGDLPMEALRRSFELNFFGHQHACQAAVRAFRKQGSGGLILFNISNQSVNPGRHFGPYGIAKAAEMALMKQYAVDHGAEGIRVSGVNAGRIRSGLMTEQMIDERAAARGVSAKEYMSGNLLGVEVTAEDVAQAFVHLAMMPKVNAAVITIDGGAMATALR